MPQLNILLTGTNGGVGGQVAQYLLEKGYRNIAFHYRSKCDNILSLLKTYDLNPKKHLYQAELTDEREVQRMRDEIFQNIGVITSVVNFAGSSTNGMSWKMSVSDFQRVMNDNLLSSFIVCKTFIPDMRAQEWGRILNTSSIVAFSGVAGAAHYCAAKAGLVGMTKSMALELVSKNITANALALGYFEFGLIETVPENLRQEIKSKIPVGRFGQQKDVGSLVEYILSPETSFLTGQTFHLNGGQY